MADQFCSVPPGLIFAEYSFDWDADLGVPDKADDIAVSVSVYPVVGFVVEDAERWEMDVRWHPPKIHAAYLELGRVCVEAPSDYDDIDSYFMGVFLAEEETGLQGRAESRALMQIRMEARKSSKVVA